MNGYEAKVKEEVRHWEKKMSQKPNLANRLAKNMQTRLNNLLPEKVHKVITQTMKQMVKGVLWGSAVTSGSPPTTKSLAVTEFEVLERIKWYRRTASAEGGIAGAGGFVLALAEFPVLLATKIKLLFEIASRYGIDVNDYRERLFILHIFQLTYSSQEKRREVFMTMKK